MRGQDVYVAAVYLTLAALLLARCCVAVWRAIQEERREARVRRFTAAMLRVEIAATDAAAALFELSDAFELADAFKRTAAVIHRRRREPP